VEPPGRASLVRLVLPGQIPDKLVQLTHGLRRVAALEALLELGQVKAALGMALAKAVRYSFAIRVSGTDLGIATCDLGQEVVVGHVNLPSMELTWVLPSASAVSGLWACLHLALLLSGVDIVDIVGEDAVEGSPGVC
jgi:hypothetical protein